MRLHVDLDTRAIITAINDKRELARVDFKRGDSASVEIVFVRNGVVEELDVSNGELGQFGIKTAGEYDASFLVHAGSWVKSGTGESAVYIFEPNFNTIQLNAELGSGDAETANDIPYIDAMLEIEWIVAGAVSSTQTIIARLHNDVIKGAEGVPTDAEPPYPSSTEINDHLADTDIHHTTASLNARDTANRSRANHTGTQAQSTVDNLVTDLSDKLSKSAGGTVAGSTVFAGGATRTNTDTNAAAELVTYGQMAKYAQPAMWPHPTEVVEDWSTLDPTVTTSGKLGRMGWLTGGSGSVAYAASRHKIFGRALNMSTGATTDDYRYIGGPTSSATSMNEYSVYRAIFRVSSWANIKLKLGWSDTTQPALGGLNLNCVECDTSVDNNWYYHIKPSSGSETTTLLGAINIPTTNLITTRSISVVIIGHRVNSSQFGGTAGHDRVIITQVNQAGNSVKVVDQEIPNAGTLYNCRPILEVYTKEAAAKTVECEMMSMGSYFALGSASNLMF